MKKRKPLSLQSRENISKSRRRLEPEVVIEAYRANGYHAERATKALGEPYGYVTHYLHRLYRRRPELQEQLEREKRKYKANVK